MTTFELNNCKVFCSDDAKLDMKKVDNLTYLAKRLEELMPGTIASVDFLFNDIIIQLKDDKDKKMMISFDAPKNEPEYDDLIRVVIRVISKYNEMYNEMKGENKND